MRLARRAGLVSAGMLCAAVTGWSAEKGQLGVLLGAQPASGNSSAFGVDGISTNAGFSYQISDRFSLRPTLGFGHASEMGWFWNMGGVALYHFRPERSLSPYLGLGAGFRARGRDASSSYAPPFGAYPRDASRLAGTFSALGGVEYKLGRRVSLYAELEASQWTGRHYELRDSAWQRRSGPELRPTFGLTFYLR